ncbi:DUF998 domain-containing protein, partial [Rhodococcus hoagii]|nr:DUF998 domain-containing protein [Prescottella equi]
MRARSRGFASQLAATDQRYGILYRSGDLLTGIVLTVAAVLGLTITPRRFLTTVGWLALGVFAVGTIADPVCRCGVPRRPARRRRFRSPTSG